MSTDVILYRSRFMRLLNIKFFDLIYKIYHSIPQFYDGISQLLSFGQWEKWQNRVFEDLTGKRILEIGVGPGSLLLRIAKKGFIVTGIEFRKDMAYEARKRIKKAGFDIDILHQSVYKLPFADETFDCLVLTFVLAEILYLDRAILEMKRILKKNGKVIIIAGGMPQDNNLVARILFRLVRPYTSLRLERNNKTHFEENGFIVQREDFGPFNSINKLVAIKQ